MPFSGDTFTHLFDWEKDPQRQEKIVNSRLEAEFDGIDQALSELAASGGGGELTQRTNIIAPHEFLECLWASNSTFDMDASAVTLFDSNGAAKRFPSLNVTVNLANTGANGRDGFTESSNQWIYGWGIGKEDGTLAGLASNSSSSPSLPSGYTYKGLLTACRNNGSSNLIPFRQLGRMVQCDTAIILSDGAATNFTAVSTTGAAPPIATYILLLTSQYTSTGSGVVIGRYTSHGSGTTATYGGTQSMGQNNIDTIGNTLMIWVPLDQANNQIVYRVGGANALTSIVPSGWIL